jgi:hypothetical protein
MSITIETVRLPGTQKPRRRWTCPGCQSNVYAGNETDADIKKDPLCCSCRAWRDNPKRPVVQVVSHTGDGRSDRYEFNVKTNRRVRKKKSC